MSDTILSSGLLCAIHMRDDLSQHTLAAWRILSVLDPTSTIKLCSIRYSYVWYLYLCHMVLRK